MRFRCNCRLPYSKDTPVKHKNRGGVYLDLYQTHILQDHCGFDTDRKRVFKQEVREKMKTGFVSDLNDSIKEEIIKSQKNGTLRTSNQLRRVDGKFVRLNPSDIKVRTPLVNVLVTKPVSASLSPSTVGDHLSPVRSDSSLSATKVDSSPSGVEVDEGPSGMKDDNRPSEMESENTPSLLPSVDGVQGRSGTSSEFSSTREGLELGRMDLDLSKPDRLIPTDNIFTRKDKIQTKETDRIKTNIPIGVDRIQNEEIAIIESSSTEKDNTSPNIRSAEKSKKIPMATVGPQPRSINEAVQPTNVVQVSSIEGENEAVQPTNVVQVSSIEGEIEAVQQTNVVQVSTIEGDLEIVYSDIEIQILDENLQN